MALYQATVFSGRIDALVSNQRVRHDDELAPARRLRAVAMIGFAHRDLVLPEFDAGAAKI
jgi:hypothetical protein